MEPGAWGYDWATQSLGDINTGTWSSRLGVGRKAGDLALCEKKICHKIQKNRKPDAIRRNLLRKAIVHKGLSCQR
jgi:hypothetical protein